jgi:hypothetical protein
MQEAGNAAGPEQREVARPSISLVPLEIKKNRKLWYDSKCPKSPQAGPLI